MNITDVRVRKVTKEGKMKADVYITINDEFVKSGTFEETTLKDGDVVEFLYFMGGGQ